MGSVITGDGKYDVEIQRHRVIAKDIFQKLSKVLRVQNIKLVMKKGVLNCYVMSTLWM